MRLRFALAALLVVCSLMLATRSARAAAVVYPAGQYAFVASERTVVVWTGAAPRVEHFVTRWELGGDATDVGILFPLPPGTRLDEVTQVPAGIFDAVDATAGAHRGPPGALARDAAVDDARVGDQVVADAAGADVLGAWMHAHGYEDRPAVRAWLAPYFKKGWRVVALRFQGARTAGGDGTRRVGPHRLAAPYALDYELPVDAPLYPYTEPESDIEAQAAFFHAYPDATRTRELSVWVVAPEEMRAAGNFLQGLPEERTWRASRGELAAALGGVARASLSSGRVTTVTAVTTVTYMHEALEQRVAFEDLRFEPPDDGTKPVTHRAHHPHTVAILFALLALGLAAAVGAAFRLDQS